MKKRERKGISLIVLVITIIVIIILAAAVILTLNNNNPIEEANNARYESDVANMQAIFTNTVAKVMAQNQGTIELNAGELNSIKTVEDGVTNVEGKVNYTVNDPQNESNKDGIIVFDTGNSNATTFYTGRKLPLYKAGKTIWFVNNDGVISLKVGSLEFGSNGVVEEEIVSSEKPMLQSWASNRTEDFHAEEYRSKITKVKFAINAKVPSSKIESWDVSAAKDKSVMAWIESDLNDGYILTIAGKEKIIANKDSSYIFYSFSNLEEIENIELLDTSNVTNMRCAFYNSQKLKSVGLSECDTSKVFDFTSIFRECSQLKSIGKKALNVKSALNATSTLQLLFYNCYNLTATINIEGNVNMYSYTNQMFYDTATISPAQITINYTTESEEAVNDIISRYTTGSYASNIVKGTKLD